MSEERIISPVGSLVEYAKLPGKCSEKIERCGIASFRVAESMGFKGPFSPMGATARVGGKGAPTAQPTAKNFALKDPLKSDVCLMASEKRAIVDRGSQ